MYPRLYALSLDQGRTVGEVGVWKASTWNWWLRWRRVKFIWKVVQEEDMIRKISMCTINRGLQGDISGD